MNCKSLKIDVARICLEFYTKPCIMIPMRKRIQWNKQSVRALRRHLGLTQAKLAQELGTRQQTISEWETGMYQPRGPSATLLTIVAERSGFSYRASRSTEDNEAN
jgi:DNA-binding transcriptional regulator YiaG